MNHNVFVAMPQEVKSALNEVYGHAILRYKDLLVSVSERLKVAEANWAIEKRNVRHDLSFL